MKIFTYTILFAAIIVLFSCESDTVSPKVLNQSNVLYQVWWDSNLYQEFSYNANNNVKEEKYKLWYTKHNYEKNGLLKTSEVYFDDRHLSSSMAVQNSLLDTDEWANSENTPLSHIVTYSYDENSRMISSTEINGYSKYEYYENGKISKRIFYSPTDAPTGFISFQYDDNGNMIKREHYNILQNGDEILSTTTEYEFDNHPNPYFALKKLMLPGKSTNPNNITKETYTIHFEVNDFIEKIQITENTYKYGSNGYPKYMNDNLRFVYR